MKETQMHLINKMFNDKTIRTVWSKDEEKYYISVVDIVTALVDSKDSAGYWRKLKQRLNQLGLEFAEDKTRLIEFGRFAEENRKKQGKGKPETFDFLGFTHYCSKGNVDGHFRVKRKTSKKKYRQKVHEFKVWIKENRTMPLNEIMETVRKKLVGHYNYYGVTDNIESMNRYFYEVRKLLYKWLNRRSQRRSYDSMEFNQMLKFYKLPMPSIKVNIYAIG